MTDIRKGIPEKAGNFIQNILKKNNLLQSYRLYTLKSNWSHIMGSQIGRYSYIYDIRDGVITIGVINSAWMSQLFIYKRQIKEKINSYLGELYVKDIKFTGSGKVPPKKSILWDEIHEGQFQTYLSSIVITPDTIKKIHNETDKFPESMQSKMFNLFVARERRRIAYEREGYRSCPHCGRWLQKEEECLFCNLAVEKKRKIKLTSILQELPWLTWEDVLHDYGGERFTEEMYNEVRRNCIYRLIEKVYHNVDTEKDDLFLAIFITRKNPSDLEDSFIVHLVNKYRRKE